jgi:hypothetical protein
MNQEPQDPIDTTLAIIGLIAGVFLLIYSLSMF